jgi:hypothetical protein
MAVIVNRITVCRKSTDRDAFVIADHLGELQ